MSASRGSWSKEPIGDSQWTPLHLCTYQMVDKTISHILKIDINDVVYRIQQGPQANPTVRWCTGTGVGSTVARLMPIGSRNLLEDQMIRCLRKHPWSGVSWQVMSTTMLYLTIARGKEKYPQIQRKPFRPRPVIPLMSRSKPQHHSSTRRDAGIVRGTTILPRDTKTLL